jgi:exodeoxyribonuclease VII large subunit
MTADIELGVSDFVALLNQTLEFAYPSVVITGELANFKIWRDRLVFFDLKDETAMVNCWAYVTQLPGPLEDGMLLKVRGQPRYHAVRGFRFNVQTIRPAGEGSLKQAAALLQAKLAAEGLFDEVRKRPLPYPPVSLGLIASKQSAAYADFIKVLAARWSGLDIQLVDVQVQGEPAPGQIVAALEQLNGEARMPEAIVLIRGGGSAEDLAAFSTEQVTRAVAASRVPTLVAIGHEVDLSLAELAADRRASTPSNAAELLVPDRREVRAALSGMAGQLQHAGQRQLQHARGDLGQAGKQLEQCVQTVLSRSAETLASQARLLGAFDPAAVLRRGYAIARSNGRVLRSSRQLAAGEPVDVQLSEGGFSSLIKEIHHGKK